MNEKELKTKVDEYFEKYMCVLDKLKDLKGDDNNENN